MQSGSPGDLDAAGADPFTETMNSGIVTLQPHGQIQPWTRELWVQMLPHQFGPHNGARLKPFGLKLPTLVPGKLPLQPRSQPRADISNMQRAGLTRALPA